MTELRWRHRFDLVAKMRLDSPLSIGAPSGTGTVDIPVAVDGQGRPFIPGTSLAGVIRTAIEPLLAAEDSVLRWFGGIGDDDAASRVVVDDAQLADPVLELRDGVGIDRNSGTAADEIKYNRQVVAAGATTELRISVTSGGGTDGDLDAVRRVVALLAGVISAPFAVGGSTSRGNGHLVLETDGLAVTDRSFDSFDSTLRSISGGVPVAIEPEVTAVRPVVVELPWRPASSLFVRSGVAGTAVDDLPLVTSIGMVGDTDHVTLVVPGSSVKGALRSHAEWIVRTVLQMQAPGGDGSEPAQDAFDEQLDVPLVGALFGRPAAADEQQNLPLPQGRAAVTVHDLRPVDEHGQLRSVPAVKWRRIAGSRRSHTNGGGGGARPATSEILDAIAEAGLKGELVPRSHVAIDRWTGAPSASALFSTLEVNVPLWEPIRLTVDGATLRRRLPDEDERRAALMLLLFVLRDTAEGLVPLGFGVNRGHGSVEADWAVKDNPIVTGVLSVDGHTQDGGLHTLETAWCRWVEARNTTGAG